MRCFWMVDKKPLLSTIYKKMVMCYYIFDYLLITGYGKAIYAAELKGRDFY